MESTEDVPAPILSAGMALFESWEESVDCNFGSAALAPDVERLVRDFYALMSSSAVVNPR